MPRVLMVSRNLIARKNHTPTGCCTPGYKGSRGSGMLGKKQSQKQKLAVSRAMKGRPKSEVQKKKQSKAMKGRYVGENNPFYGKHHPKWLLRQIGSKLKGRVSTFKGRHHTRSARRLLGESMVRRMLAGFVPRRRRLYRGAKGRIWMRSSWEVAFAKWLDTRDLDWMYEPCWFRTRFGFYIPDFFVSEWKCYIEIKGVKLPKSMKKLREFIRTCGKEVRVYYQKDLQQMGVL